MSDIESLWLVKAGSRILGPFSEFQLIHLIHTKEVSPIDEVKKPLQRWVFVRQCEELKAAVERYRDQLSGANHQTVLDSTAITEEMDIEKTAPAFQLQSESVAVREMIVSEAPPVQNYSSVPEPTIATLDPRAVQKAQEKLKRKENSRSGGVVWVLGLLVFLAIAIIYYWPSNVMTTESEDSNYIVLAEQGQFKEVMDELDALSKVRSLTLEEKILKLGAAAKVNRQSFEVRSFAEDIQSSQALTAQQASQIHRSISISLLQESLFDEAATEVSRASDVSTWDLLNIAILKRDWVNAEILLAQAKDKLLPGQRELVLGLIQLSKGESVTAISDSYNLAAKTYFLKALSLQRQNAGLEELGAVIRKLMEFNPFVDDIFVENMFVDQSSLKWSNLTQYCQRPNPQDNIEETRSMYIWLLQFCNLMSANFTDVNFDRLILNDPGYPDLSQMSASWVAFANVHMDRFAEARTYLPTAGDSYLGHLTKGKLCLVTQDFQCAEQSYQNILRNNPNDPWALTGMINSKFNSGLIPEAKALLRSALVSYPDFKELIEWKYKLL